MVISTVSDYLQSSGAGFNSPDSKFLEAPGLELGRVTITKHLGIKLSPHVRESGIHEILASGIRNPAHGNPESRPWNPESSL